MNTSAWISGNHHFGLLNYEEPSDHINFRASSMSEYESSDEPLPFGKEWLDGEDDPFVFRAAKASWLSPVIAFGIAFFGSCIVSNAATEDPDASRWPQLIISGLSLAFAVAGFCFGVFALFGIRRCGIERILIPAIVGIAISSGYFYLVAIAFLALVS